MFNPTEMSSPVESRVCLCCQGSGDGAAKDTAKLDALARAQAKKAAGDKVQKYALRINAVVVSFTGRRVLIVGGDLIGSTLVALCSCRLFILRPT